MRGREDDFACAVIKNHMLALIAKAQLAEETGENDTADEALAQAQELVEKAVDCDGYFANSATAGLLRQLAPEVVIPVFEELPPERPAEPAAASEEPEREFEEEAEEPWPEPAEANTAW